MSPVAGSICPVVPVVSAAGAAAAAALFFDRRYRK